jgi:hypothetical protein
VSTAQFRELIGEYFDELAACVIEALRELFPACPAARIRRRLSLAPTEPFR